MSAKIKFTAVTLAISVAAISYGITNAATESPFPDVSIDQQTFDAIQYLYDQKILKGHDDGYFYPETSMNRAEWATILVRLAGADPSLENYNNCFPDVGDQWFASAVCLAKDQGWVTGYKAGDLAGFYAPERKIQDIEMLVTLARLTNWETGESEIWYEPALEFAKAHNIYTEENPIKAILRDTMADVIFRMLAIISLGNETYETDLNEEIQQEEIYDLIDIELEDYEDFYLEEAVEAPEFSEEIDLLCDLPGAQCNPDPIRIEKGTAVPFSDLLITLTEITDTDVTFLINDQEYVIDVADNIVESNFILTLIDYNPYNYEALIHLTPYGTSDQEGENIIFTVDYISEEENIIGNMTMYENVVVLNDYYYDPDATCNQIREYSVYQDVVVQDYTTEEIIQDQSFEVVNTLESVQVECEDDTVITEAESGEHFLELDETINIQDHQFTLASISEDESISLLYSDFEYVIDIDNTEVIGDFYVTNLASYCDEEFCNALIRFSNVDIIFDELEEPVFVGEEGAPQIKQPTEIYFDTESTEFNFEIRNTASDIKSVQVLLYDTSVKGWVYGLNSADAATDFEKNLLNEYSRQFALSIDNVLIGGVMYNTLDDIDDGLGFILEVESENGDIHLLGENGAQIQVTKGQNPIELANQITGMVFSAKECLSCADTDDCQCPDVNILEKMKNAFKKIGIEISEKNIEASSRGEFKEEVKCGQNSHGMIRLSEDFEVLPNYKEAVDRFKKTGKQQQGAHYLLFFNISTSCYSTCTCYCTLSSQVVAVETGIITSSTYYSGDCDELESNFDKMIKTTEKQTEKKFKNEDPKWSEPAL